ncbi:MAG: hypothetical protein OXE96_11610 [Gemmatimonadetes bacterium]|nr:hypothetical protein [Gemmatimonadota bacterium]
MSQPSHLKTGIAVSAGAALLLAAPATRAQERAIVSNQVEVANNAASLHLELSDGEALAVTLADGVATVNGEVLGTYEPGGPVDRSWRDLLADILTLTNGPLARELGEWDPDTDRGGAGTGLLRQLDLALEGAITGAEVERPRARDPERLQNLLEVIARNDNIQGLGEALDDVDLESLSIWLHEDHTIPAEVTVMGDVLLAGGRLDVRGRVRGDVIVLDGDLTLSAEGSIAGDVRLIEAELDRDGGTIEGRVVDVSRELRMEEAQVRDRIREELQRELGRVSSSRGQGRGFFSRVGRAAGGILESVLTFLVVGVLTLVLTRFWGERLGVVTRAVGHQPGRSAVVGLAGGFVALPVYICGTLVLAISIVGIPVLLAWVPFFPVVVAVAGFMGYLGVSHHVGSWVLDREIPWLAWVDRNHDTHVRLVGVAAMLAPFLIASTVRVLPLLGWFGGLIAALGTVVGVLATVTGLGAVIMTRGGSRPAGWSYAFDDDEFESAAWSSAGYRADPAAGGEDGGPGGAAPDDVANDSGQDEDGSDAP